MGPIGKVKEAANQVRETAKIALTALGLSILALLLAIFGAVK